MTLRERADARLRTAHEILRELDLLHSWSSYGDPVVVGSVAIGVVVRPDIDLEIYSDEPRVADGFAVVEPLAELPKVRRVRFLDARDRHERGLYWKLEYELTADETWSIDMWMFDRAIRGPDLASAVRNALTDETRDTILAVKEEAVALGERAYGYWLYRAVLDADVRTYEEFKTWLGDRNIYDRTPWSPRSTR